MPSPLMWVALLYGMIFLYGGQPASACGPGKFFGSRRTPRKLTPLVYKEHIPNTEEFSLAASEPPEGRLTRNDPKFKDLVPNYSKDIIFRDEEGTGSDRLMSNRCKEKLDTLAISVMNMYPGVKLRVTEAWDEEGLHAPQSLHNEGRAVDVTTSDRDRSKYGMLARLAVEAGFDFVYYESRAHIHCSVKPESADGARSGGCFSANSTIQTETGRKRMAELRIGDRVLVTTPRGDLEYSEVILFLDRNPTDNRTYIAIETESGAKITLTPSHLIFTEPDQRTADVTNLYATYAKNVQIGHYVYVVSRTGAHPRGQLILEKVKNIAVESEVGVYAPLTRHGTVVVNDVVASCYAMMYEQSLAHLAFMPVRLLHNFKQASVHALQKLHFVKFRTNNTIEEHQGIHWYATMLYYLSRTLLPKSYLYT
ncbi:sonic hedgehog protein-like [Argiope bruennichi]|uniref:sonic hedgehog protein-like n=1 Tax=Argiope bruennichi TaxID=94029 RepID=UPI0024957600|nr:sonic hedgehog protein-like [Argiope bruennichi]